MGWPRREANSLSAMTQPPFAHPVEEQNVAPPSPRPLALVTGAARRLGRVLALTLAQRGYAIALHYYHSGQAAQDTAAAIRALGLPAYPLQADLRATAEIEALFAALDGLPHPLKVLVNSAAVMARADVRTVSTEEWNATLALNLTAPFLCARRAAERMSQGGLIVNVTDAGARRAWSGFPAYIVSKAGLEALTRLLARAYAPTVRVNAIAPGLVLPSEEMPAEEWQRLVARLPIPRPARESEIASALEFLLTNEYLTGQTLTVDGGYSLL